MIANETCAAQGVVEEVAYRAGDGGEIMVVAPAIARTRLEHWLTSDLERRQEEARERLETSLVAMHDAGLRAGGHLGDADPLQALDDALRVFAPDEVIIATHPPQRSGWLERHVVRRARERYDLPITHVVVNLELESVVADADRSAARSSTGRRMRVFHASDYDEAIAIQRGGFRDRRPAGGPPGVWVTDRPPPAASSSQEWVVFAVDVPEDALSAFEREPGEEGRRFLLPADLLNRHGPPIAEGDWSE